MNLRLPLLKPLSIAIWALLSACAQDTNQTDEAIVASQNAEPTPSTGQEKSCKDFLANLPTGIVADSVETPEDPQVPDGPKIRVFYFYNAESIKDPNKKPVAFYNGGPGGDSHGMVESTPKFIPKDIFNRISPVYIDQRGTGCSSPYPTSLASLRHYGSRGIVSDSEIIRQKLFGKNSKWSIFGQSYGGRIVHRYITLAPNSLEHASSYGGSIQSNPFDRIFYRIFAERRINDEYFKAYPDDVAVILKLKRDSESMCFGKNAGQDKPSLTKNLDNFEFGICNGPIWDGLFMFMGDTSYWPILHQTILDAEKNEQVYDSDSKLVSFREYYSTYLFDEMSSPAYCAIAKLEMNTGLSDLETEDAAIEKIKQLDLDPQDALISETRFFKNLKDKTCENDQKQFDYADPILIEDIKKSLDLNPSLQLYLYSGDLDPFVPRESFVEEVNFLGTRIKYTNHLGRGHFGYRKEKEVWENLVP
jgi:pimeloyl-ACP methyl ester carboxylesterase